MSNYIMKGDGIWYDKRTGLPREPLVRGIEHGHPPAAGNSSSRLTSNEILGLQVATGNPLIGKQVETRDQAERLGLTFETKSLKAPTARTTLDKYKKEEIKKTFIESAKAAAALPVDIQQKLKEGYKIVDDGNGGFKLEHKHADLIPGTPDGIEEIPDNVDAVEGYDETMPVVDDTLLFKMAKEDAEGRRSVRKSRGSQI